MNELQFSRRVSFFVPIFGVDPILIMVGIIQSLKSHYCGRVYSDMGFVSFAVKGRRGRVEVNEGPDLLTGLRSPGKNHFKCGSQHIIGARVCLDSQ